MSYKWLKYSLSDVAVIISGGTPKTSKKEYWDGSIPWLSVADFNNGKRYVKSAAKSITESGLENSSTNLLNIGDSIISARGTVGIVAQIGRQMTFNQSCYGLRAKENIVTPDFLYYSLKKVTDNLKQLANGGVFDTIIKDTFSKIEIELPPINEQNAITEILGSLDDRIENLHEMNTTLENIAQAIFKSWFVDFDPVRAKAEGRAPEGMDAETAALFPNSFEESELGLIPKGWKHVNLKEVVNIFDSQRIPLAGQERKKRQGIYPYYGAASLMDHIDDYIFDGIYLLLGEDGSVMNLDGSPVAQYVWGKIWVNNHAHVLQGKNNISTEYLLLAIKRLNIKPYVTGAVQAKLSQANMWRIPFLMPTDLIIIQFNRIISPLFEKLRNNCEQQKNLSAIRDILLPRLISGQLRLPEAEAIIKEAL